MAILEQLVYGSRNEHQLGREVLARSSGLIDDCVAEVVQLCEGWGAVPPNGLRRPILMAFPLESRLPALPGELHVVIRLSQGLRPVYHAVVLTSRDFQDFDHNPFALLQEGIFLDTWAVGNDIERRAASPESLAPLVSPPPGPDDVGGVDEAVRQMLANERLLLPLESTTSDSERFLALVVAGLPRAMRRTLRLASWAPSGANRYSLAATHKDSAHFAAWQPYLMTSVIGKLEPEADEYLDDLKRCLQNGDLAGIERISREARFDPTRHAGRTSRRMERTLSATVSEATGLKLAGQAERKPAAPAKPRKAPALATSTHTRQSSPPRTRTASRRLHPRPRVQPSGRARRGFAILLSLAIVGAGAYYLWTAGHWTRLPGLAGLTSSLEARAEHGVVDVGAVYRTALDGVYEGHLGGAASSQEQARRRGLDLLRQAGQLLEVQGLNYLQDGEQTLSGEDRKGVAPAPAARLQERGEVLARELRRLAMARIALRDGADWQDLAQLDARALSARYDSLVARRRIPGTEEPDLATIDQLLRRLDVSARQIGGLATLEALLGQEQWGDGWSRRVESAVDDLGAVRQGRARDLRDDAELLARLKRAEHGSDLAALAYRETYDDGRNLTPAVADILPALYRRVQERGQSQAPALVAATADFYRGVTEAAGGAVAAERLSGLLPVLASNRAVRFDPLVYGDHLARLRFLLFEKLVAAHAPAESLVTVMGSERAVAEHLRFLGALNGQSTAADWQGLVDEVADPFLVRWARRELARRDAERSAELATLPTLIDDLRTGRATLQRLGMADARCGALWCQLADRARTAAAIAARGALPDDLLALQPELHDHVAFLSRPPVLSLSGVTVRLDEATLAGPAEVVVELRAADQVVRTSGPIALGPAAPAGSGWVGTGETPWDLDLATGEPVQVVVRSVGTGRELAHFSGRWLADWDPLDLSGLEADAGVRLTWKLAHPYWETARTPSADQ
ncbi:MAG: hypothetical protein R3D98_09950 [Candidatus Krumholzibacteriia bacterium]